MSEPNTAAPLSGTPLGEISQAPPAFEMFLDKHQVKLIGLALILIVVAVISVIMRGIEQSKEEAAGALLVSAEDTTELQEIVNNYEGTAAAFSSKLLLAEQQWEDGNQEDSIATLRAFTEAEKDHPARANAQASLAAKLFSQGKLDEAEEILTDITQDPAADYLAPYAWICLGDIAQEKGDLDAAEKAYATVEQEFSGSTYVQAAVSRRLVMHAKSPAEVTVPIEVPDVKFTDGEAEDAPAQPVEMKDLIDALKPEVSENPLDSLLPAEKSDKDSE